MTEKGSDIEDEKLNCMFMGLCKRLCITVELVYGLYSEVTSCVGLHIQCTIRTNGGKGGKLKLRIILHNISFSGHG